MHLLHAYYSITHGETVINRAVLDQRKVTRGPALLQVHRVITRGSPQGDPILLRDPTWPISPLASTLVYTYNAIVWRNNH
jgi:hypothetical protein